VGVANNPGLTQADVQALVASALAAQSTGFVNNGAEQTVAQLLANYPASAAMVYKYARVSDLYGQARSVMICEASAGAFYWRPQRTDFAAANTSTGGALTLTPLVSAPITILTGGLAAMMTITPSAVNVWPGATFTVVANGAFNLLGINIGGLVGSGTVPLLSGSSRVLTYVAGSGWRAG
jgi:hypothetical protein